MPPDDAPSSDQDIALTGLQVAVNVAQGHPPPPAELVPQPAVLSRAGAAICGAQARPYLEAVLLGAQAPAGLDWLQTAGILATLLPEIEATVDFTQEVGRLHKDVWKHTKQVVAQTPAEVGLRWAALLHDIGKVPTRRIDEGDKVSFHGHAEVGARMFDAIARRLSFPPPLAKRVRFLILHHLRATQYLTSWTDAAVRRLAREMDPYLEDLIALSRADITSARQFKRDRAAWQINELVSRIATIKERDATIPPLPSGIGDAIMEHFGMPPSKRIGDLKQALEQAIDAGQLSAHQDAAYYLRYLEITQRCDPQDSR